MSTLPKRCQNCKHYLINTSESNVDCEECDDDFSLFEPIEEDEL